MTDANNEPVEISTHMRPGEWTRESLAELVASYQDKMRGMGAPDAGIATSVENLDDGSVNVNVSWRHAGAPTFAETGQNTTPESENSRGHGEDISPGVGTGDARGLGAVLGDAERSAIDAPPTRRAMEAEGKQPSPDLRVYTDESGKTYVEDPGPQKE